VAGVVSALGYGTRGLSVGQRVFGLADWTRDGTLAEYVAVEARNLAPLPGDVDFTVGARLPISGLTAWQGLFVHGRFQVGQSVLVHGAAGAVGSMATQLARESGAYVIGTGRTAHRQTALDFGAQEFVDLENDSLEDVGGVDLVFDVFGGDIGKRSAGLVRAGGTLVSVAGPPEVRPADGLVVDFVVVSDRATGSDRPAGGGRAAADAHRSNRAPRRCCRCLQPDRADQWEDDHPRSSVRDEGQRTFAERRKLLLLRSQVRQQPEQRIEARLARPAGGAVRDDLLSPHRSLHSVGL
jgi:NADPH:quinone reductase-like Zn-dependent oxidoreductase